MNMSAATSNAATRLLKSSSSVSEMDGYLEASILSVYDLPFPEPPEAVELSTCGIAIRSGAPVSRHRDRNSFRFSTSSPNGTANSVTNAGSTSNASSKSDMIKLVAPLKELYKSKLNVHILYADKSRVLTAEYELGKLRVNESKWLILNLTDNATPTPGEPTTNNSEEQIPPTIRIKLCLSGPYRSEIASIIGLAQAWFGFVDHMEGNAKQALSNIPKLPNEYTKFILIPAVPVVAGLVVASPVLMGVVMVGT